MGIRAHRLLAPLECLEVMGQPIWDTASEFKCPYLPLIKYTEELGHPEGTPHTAPTLYTVTGSMRPVLFLYYCFL